MTTVDHVERRSSVRIAQRLSVQSTTEVENTSSKPVKTYAYPKKRRADQSTGSLTEPSAKKQKIIRLKISKPISLPEKEVLQDKKEVEDGDFIPDGIAGSEDAAEAWTDEDQAWVLDGVDKYEEVVEEVSSIKKTFRSGEYEVEEAETTKLTQTTTVTKIEEEAVEAPTRSLIVKVKVAGLGEMIKKQMRLLKKQVTYDNAKYRIKFDWTPYYYHSSPTRQECIEVYNILRDHLIKQDGTSYDADKNMANGGPAHGASGVSVNALFKVIMAQATTNDLALAVQESLLKKFTYQVNDEEKQGTIVNYHKVRRLTPEELKPYIAAAGFGTERPKWILNALNRIYDINVARYIEQHGSLGGAELDNTPNADDFVPGMLSLSFLDGKSKGEIFNWYCELGNFGPKSAACMLDFNYGFPVCAVDTHVRKMASYLGWLPAECTNNEQAFNHLDARIPPEYRHAVHQLFWHHGQKCDSCRRFFKPSEKPKDGVQREACPLEHLIQRRWKVQDKGSRKIELDEAGKKIKKERLMTDFVAWKVFKSAEEAASKGYIEGKQIWDDDFGADKKSKNVREKKRWELVGVEAASMLVKQKSIGSFFTSAVKKEEDVVKKEEEN